jgi:hypothetical protein
MKKKVYTIMSERSFDIGRDLKSVNLIQSSLDCRANAEQFNHQCFQRSAKICEPLDIEVKKPRICGRQIMRDNVEAESPKDYFRKSITLPFLYCTLNEMKTRFTDLHARTALGLQLVPSIIENIAP